MADADDDFPAMGVVPLERMVGEDEEDTRLLRVMADGAENFLKCFPWCKAIRERYFGDGYGGVVAVFLFRIVPRVASVDEWLWVIFGDVPPAYLVLDESKKPSEALRAYVSEVERWVALARRGSSSKDVIPVCVDPTPANATKVERRLDLIKTDIIPAFAAAETVSG